MTQVLRLTLLSHAVTDAMVAEHFPADEPLNAIGRRQLEAVADCGIEGFGTRGANSPDLSTAPAKPRSCWA